MLRRRSRRRTGGRRGGRRRGNTLPPMTTEAKLTRKWPPSWVSAALGAAQKITESLEF